MQVTLQTEEARALVGLIDLAVKTGGLGVAETAVHFAKKLEAAAQQEAAEKSQAAKPEAATSATSEP